MIKIFDIMKGKDIHPEVYHYNSILSGTKDSFFPIPFMNKMFFSKAFSKVGDSRKMMVYLEDMKNHRLLPDRNTYCILLECLSKNGDVANLLNVLEEMSDRQEILFGCYYFRLILF
jgi:pentatricopeptide repeat protein